MYFGIYVYIFHIIYVVYIIYYMGYIHLYDMCYIINLHIYI